MRFGVARNWLLLAHILLLKHRMFQMLVAICPLCSSILFFKVLVSCDFLFEILLHALLFGLLSFYRLCLFFFVVFCSLNLVLLFCYARE